MALAPGQGRLAITIARIEQRTGMELSDFVPLGTINTCVRIAMINGLPFPDARCHRGLSAKFHGSTYTLVDGFDVHPGNFVIGSNTFDIFGPEGEMGVVLHEILHLKYSHLKELEVDRLAQHLGVVNEIKRKQSSLHYSKGISTKAQRLAVARMAGLL
jgi:hypothetical protein